jgi:hypothetical protein
MDDLRLNPLDDELDAVIISIVNSFFSLTIIHSSSSRVGDARTESLSMRLRRRRRRFSSLSARPKRFQSVHAPPPPMTWNN